MCATYTKLFQMLVIQQEYTMKLSLLQIFFGLLLLYIGAEGLVRSSSSLASRLKISPLVIGLTIVAYGTSS